VVGYCVMMVDASGVASDGSALGQQPVNNPSVYLSLAWLTMTCNNPMVKADSYAGYMLVMSNVSHIVEISTSPRRMETIPVRG
jgi:hypothetical protein